MIGESLQLYDYSWRLSIFYDITIKDLDEILLLLWENNCSNKGIREVAEALINPNSGFTYTKGRFSIMGIGWADSPKEFFNTLIHEMNHLQDDICYYYGLPTDGETASYLIGYIAMNIYPSFKHYLYA